MQVLGKKGLGNILKIFLEICFVLGIIVLIGLPFLLNKIGLSLNASAFIIYPNGTALLVITYKFIQLFDSLKNNNPFSHKNVKILKVTGVAALIGSAFWLIDLLYEIFLAKSEDVVSLLTLGFLTVLFLGVAIALYMLSELFKRATEYKEENELTI